MYTSVEKIEDFLNVNIATSYEDAVEAKIAEATAFIDTYTGTTFNSEPDTEKFYNGNGKRKLFIDDFISLDSVEIDRNERGNWQQIQARYGGRTPIYRIKNMNGIFPIGMDNVRVTGEYGFSEEPPADIVSAATVLSAGLLDTKGEVVSESLENLSVTYKEDKGLADFNKAIQTLKSYKKNV